jgi:NADPH:quinone reductase-like Zn-dependent oxidoreductase
MKAAFIEQYGGPEVLKYGNFPDPAAGPGEVVIDMFAASVNAADWQVRIRDYKQLKFSYILGQRPQTLVELLLSLRHPIG